MKINFFKSKFTNGGHRKYQALILTFVLIAGLFGYNPMCLKVYATEPQTGVDTVVAFPTSGLDNSTTEGKDYFTDHIWFCSWNMSGYVSDGIGFSFNGPPIDHGTISSRHGELITMIEMVVCSNFCDPYTDDYYSINIHTDPTSTITTSGNDPGDIVTISGISATSIKIYESGSENNLRFKNVKVYWSYVPTDSITLNKSSSNLSVNGTETLTATILPNDASLKNITGNKIRWTSSDSTIATVGEYTGIVTAVSSGSVTITATTTDSCSKTATCVYTISDTPTPPPAPDPSYYYTPTPEPVSEIAKEAEATITDTTVKAENKVGVELTKSKAEDFIDNTKEGETAVKIELKKFTIELDKTALDTIAEGTKEAEDVITIKADEYDKNKLTDKQKEVVDAKKPELVFEAYVERNNEKVHDFNGGQATVGIVFTPAEDPNHYFVEYINPDGTVERFPTWYENGKLCFTTGHFSEYMVIYDAKETNGKPAEIVPDAFLTITKKMAVGNTFNLVSTVAKGKKLTFTSSDKTVAKVSKKGVITAKGAGECTVTAECEGYKLVVNVKVSNTPSGQVQTPEDVAWTDTTDNAVIAMYKRINKGKKFKLNFTGAEDAIITYEIEDDKIAYVKNGKVGGRKSGDTIVDVHVKEGNVENVYRFFIKVK